MNINCPECNSSAIGNYGFYSYKGTRTKKYICKNCNGQFTQKSFDPFVRMRYQQKIIENACLAHINFGLSTYAIANMLRELKVDVTPEAVRLWIKKYKEILKNKVPEDTWNLQNTWHLHKEYGVLKNVRKSFLVIFDSALNIIKIKAAEEKESIDELLRETIFEFGIAPKAVMLNKHLYKPTIPEIELQRRELMH